jgi:23S rRNA (guanine745-N1)-methyltransferase
MSLTLLCPVRGCGFALGTWGAPGVARAPRCAGGPGGAGPALDTAMPARACAREARRLTCSRGHAFDIARSGYVNLLQPQDRRAARPGDSAEALAARRSFRARAFETPLLEAMAGMLPLGPADAVLEVGCGEGDQLADLVARAGCEGHGLDLSVAAIAAARRHPRLRWVVANADRRLPYAAGAFRALLSIVARRNPAEFRRVLRDDGALLVAVPGPDDLIELRRAVLGEGIARDRAARAVAEFAPFFALERHERLRRVVRLDAAAIRDAMAGSYRALRRRQRARLADLDGLDVTLSRDALLFRPRPAGSRPRARRGAAAADRGDGGRAGHHAEEALVDARRARSARDGVISLSDGMDAGRAHRAAERR